MVSPEFETQQVGISRGVVYVHPNVFLKTFWQAELRPEIFVAMTFSDAYLRRFEEVIAPAIRAVEVDAQALKPIRVDESRSGDEILTEIMDGIAHSQLVLADVSTLGNDSKTGKPYRNSNVMYEVGIALACRQPTEVLLIRDDHDPFLFDVSTIPHMTLDFTGVDAARAELSQQLVARLNERKLLQDARVQNAVSSLSREEVLILRNAARLGPDKVWGGANGNLARAIALPQLLEKQLMRLAGSFEDGTPAYETTQFGRTAAALVKSGLKTYVIDKPSEPPTEEEGGEASLDSDERPTPAGPTPEGD